MVRNTLEHPVTKQEAIEALQDYQRQLLEKELVGDLRPHILELVIELVDYYWTTNHRA